jgi:prophage regulatory protein
MFHLNTSTTIQGDLKMKRTILRIPAVKSDSGLSRSTIYLRSAQGLWTKPVSLGARAVGWPSDEVETINAARIAGKTDDEIRTLVAKLEAARKDAK